jgi:hypothetical protein
VLRQICEVCLKEFTSRRDGARTCSPRCRKALSRLPRGHLDRLKRVTKNLDEIQWLKVRKQWDDFNRKWHRQLGTPMRYGPKTESALARRLRQWNARKQHIENIFTAMDEQGLPTPPALLLTIRRLNAEIPRLRIG